MQVKRKARKRLDPRIEEVEEILQSCVYCGLCNATCPTYLLQRDEREGPRGRIALISAMVEDGMSALTNHAKHIDSCLGCRACMTTCPNDVNFAYLLEYARDQINHKTTRGPREAAVRKALLRYLPNPDKLRASMRYARFLKPLSALLSRAGLRELAGMLEVAPVGLATSATFSGPGRAKTKHERRKRVILFTGCSQQVLRPEVNDATIRLLARHGVDVEVAASAGCCGAVARNMGKRGAAADAARNNIDAWTKLIDKEGVDAILTNAASCGVTIKDYPHLLASDKDYCDKATMVAALACDVSEFLDGYDVGPPKRWSSMRIAYHSSCGMRHGLSGDAGVRRLLGTAGFAVVDIPEAHICCGGTSTYNILQPDTAHDLRERKVVNIDHARADLVASCDISCIAHLSAGLVIPVVHTIELLDWAYGGPIPRGLEKLARLVSDVPGGDVKPVLLPPQMPSKTRDAADRTDEQSGKIGGQAGNAEARRGKPSEAGVGKGIPAGYRAGKTSGGGVANKPGQKGGVISNIKKASADVPV